MMMARAAKMAKEEICGSGAKAVHSRQMAVVEVVETAVERVEFKPPRILRMPVEAR